ncbi:MAG: DinB family protein [Gemmatimonadaceae bacterium]|nr:DinB family protein [Gemmatimonadaceae bacterium]
MLSSELAALYRRDIARLIQEIRAFPNSDTLWHVVPGVSNAAGTLALHLEGNLREYIGRQLGSIAYQRNRPLEFSARGVEQAEIVARLEGVRELVPLVIAALDSSVLDADFPELYDGRALSTRQFLLHLYGHLSYHLGQVDYLRRVVTGSGAIELARLE